MTQILPILRLHTMSGTLPIPTSPDISLLSQMTVIRTLTPTPKKYKASNTLF